MSLPLIDDRTLKNLLATIGTEAFERLAQSFLETAPARVQAIMEAFAQEDFECIELEAHTLGSAAATYGARQLEHLSREIEALTPDQYSLYNDKIYALQVLSEQSFYALKRKL